MDADESDKEWNEYIRTEYGEIALTRTTPKRGPGAAHVDVDDML
jgi:hypothetical protein